MSAGRRSRGITPVASPSVSVTDAATRRPSSESPPGTSLIHSAENPNRSIRGASARTTSAPVVQVMPIETAARMRQSA